MEFWLISLVKYAWSFLHNHIKTTQDTIHNETPAHFLFTMVSTFFIWAICITYLNSIFHMKTDKDKDTKIAILKIELQKKTFQYENEKAKKKKNKNKSEPCHPELDWASLALCFPIEGAAAESDFETIA